MGDAPAGGDLIDFGGVPDAINALLQQGVLAYRRDRDEADRIFRQALEAAPEQLPTYFCLYKIHAYQGNPDAALEAAEAGLCEAARQAGWNLDWRDWKSAPSLPSAPERFALYTLKALAFIHLRRNEPAIAREMLKRLARLDPTGAVGWPVVQALADSVD